MTAPGVSAAAVEVPSEPEETGTGEEGVGASKGSTGYAPPVENLMLEDFGDVTVPQEDEGRVVGFGAGGGPSG